MDWPLTAALGSLAAVVGVVSFGAAAVLRSSEAPPLQRPQIALAALEPGPQLRPVQPAPILTSVVVLPPPDVAREQPRPLDIALPPLTREPPPKPVKHVVAHAPAHPAPPRDVPIKGVMTASEVARIKASLRLTSEQEPLWRPVEAVLRDIGKQQMVQIRNGSKPEVDSQAMQRVYWAAQSLLATLQPAQKEQVRRLARSMGYTSVASLL